MERSSHMKGKLGFKAACRQSLLPRKEPLRSYQIRFYPIHCGIRFANRSPELPLCYSRVRQKMLNGGAIATG